jgi:regulator of protease activity HflC (stomatin/prohibitin superfamily)
MILIQREKNIMDTATFWMILIFAIISIAVVINYTIGFQGFLPVMIVDSQKAIIIDNRLGKDRVITEGINHYLPWIEVVVGELTLKEHTIDPDPQAIITKDNIKIDVDMIATVKIINPLDAVMEVDDYEKSVKSLIVTSVLNRLGKMELVEIQTQIDEISKDIISLMHEDSKRWGVEIIQVKFESITPPPNIILAMEKEIVAEKEKRASILKAEGDHKVHELHADSERVLIEKRAEATHKVIKDLKDLMPDLSDEKIMQFLTKTAYIDSMKELSSSSNSKFVLYPTETEQPMEKVMNAEYMTRSMHTDTK